MTNEQPLKRNWFYWLVAAFTAFHLMLGVVAVPIVLSDLGNQNVVGGIGVKFFTRKAP